MVNETRVEERSHKSEMGAALRGDFERLRARRRPEGTVGAGRVRADSEPVAPSATDPPASARDPAQLSWRERFRGLR